MECCKEFLALCEGQEQEVINSIVTGNETMVLYHGSLSKGDSKEWHRPGSPRPVQAKMTKSQKKNMATVFWVSQVILLIDFKKRKATVIGEYYVSLMHKLRNGVNENRRGKPSRRVRLLLDNAPVHIAVTVKVAIQECDFYELSHPPYSPDLGPSDYFLFSKLKSELRG